jgi:hypothetical protein
MPPPNPKDLRARRIALNIPHKVMAIGIGLSHLDILSIEADTLIDGYESELADFYVYWLNRLERLTEEQLEIQIEHAQEGRRFR